MTSRSSRASVRYDTSRKTSGSPGKAHGRARLRRTLFGDRDRAVVEAALDRDRRCVRGAWSAGDLDLANLDRMAYRGEVYLINPNRDRIDGRPCLGSIDELPLDSTPRYSPFPEEPWSMPSEPWPSPGRGGHHLLARIRRRAGEAGRLEQLELARIAARSGMLVEGPNCLGYVNHVDRVALTFVETPALAFANELGIGIVSQSGAMAAVLGVMLGEPRTRCLVFRFYGERSRQRR